MILDFLMIILPLFWQTTLQFTGLSLFSFLVDQLILESNIITKIYKVDDGYFDPNLIVLFIPKNPDMNFFVQEQLHR